MKVSNVIKPLQQALISKYINEHIPERNLLNVTNVFNLFRKPIVFTHIKAHIVAGEEDGWSTGWALRDLSAGILWARNNCLGLAAQLPEAQIRDRKSVV